MVKMKVCLVAPTPPPYGGIANWTENIVGKMQAENIPFEILNISPGKRALEGRTLWDRVFKSGFSMLKQRTVLKNMIRKNGINVIHMTTSGQLAIIRDILFMRLAKKYNIPVVYHIHFGKVPQILETNGVQKRLLLKALKRADKIIAIDSKSYDAIKEILSDSKVEYIPNSINVSKLPMPSRSISKEVTFLGWCIKLKGIEELLQAWAKIAGKYDWILNIVGPYDNAYIEGILAQYGREKVKIWGELGHDEAMKVLNMSEVFVLPSYSEGFPMSILEAMALGKTVIATDVGAIPTMLSDSCGRIIQKENVEQLAVALEEIMSDETIRQKYGSNARQKVYKNYTEEIVFAQYKDCWTQGYEKKSVNQKG